MWAHSAPPGRKFHGVHSATRTTRQVPWLGLPVRHAQRRDAPGTRAQATDRRLVWAIRATSAATRPAVAFGTSAASRGTRTQRSLVGLREIEPVTKTRAAVHSDSDRYTTAQAQVAPFDVSSTQVTFAPG